LLSAVGPPARATSIEDNMTIAPMFVPVVGATAGIGPPRR
jgi:hypothetical protein